MITRFDSARRLVWLWLPPLVFVVLAVGALLLYATFFAGRVAALETAYARATEDLESLRADAERLDQTLQRIDGQRDDVDTLYRDVFGTEADRFTASVRALRGLARQAGLDPSAFGYTEEPLEEEKLEQRIINFGVDGTYDQLRTFINLLELTEEFFVLEQVTLGGAGPRRGELSIRLQVSTLFVDPASLPAARAAPAVAASADGEGRVPTFDEPALEEEET